MISITKVGKQVNILYGARNYSSNRVVTGEIYDCNDKSVPIQFGEVGNSGMYTGFFKPMVPGFYKILVYEDGRPINHVSVEVNLSEKSEAEKILDDKLTEMTKLLEQIFGKLKDMLQTLEIKVDNIDEDLLNSCYVDDEKEVSDLEEKSEIQLDTDEEKLREH